MFKRCLLLVVLTGFYTVFKVLFIDFHVLFSFLKFSIEKLFLIYPNIAFRPGLRTWYHISFGGIVRSTGSDPLP